MSTGKAAVLPLADLISHRFPVAAALEAVASGDATKAVIDPSIS